jgi:hypothetical protein
MPDVSGYGRVSSAIFAEYMVVRTTSRCGGVLPCLRKRHLATSRGGRFGADALLLAKERP